MSRSHRQPYIGNHGGSKAWKREANKRLRQMALDLDDGGCFKKVSDYWNSPLEDRHSFWDVPQMRRK